MLQVRLQRLSFERNLGQTHWLILESFPEKQETTGMLPEGTDSGGSRFMELLLPRGQWCRQAPFWSPSSSLLVSGDHRPNRDLYQPRDPKDPTASHARTQPCPPVASTSSGTPYAMQPTMPGLGPIHQWAGSHQREQG